MTAQGRQRRAETVRLWSLTEDTVVEVGDDGSLTVITWWGEYFFPAVAKGVRESLLRMALGPVSMANVTSSRVPETEPSLAGLRSVLNRLAGSVVHSLALADGLGPILSASPVRQAPHFPLDVVAPSRLVKLSRFAAMRPDRGVLLIESPSACYRVALVQRPAVLVASSLAAATTIADVTAATGVSEHVTWGVVAYLVAAGVALAADEQGVFAEDDDPDLALWTHDDLMFHTRSRTWQSTGQGDLGRGSSGAPTPVVKQVSAGPTFPLYRPDLTSLIRASPTLTSLLETDHHCPDFSERAMSAEQLGEFLFRTARIRSVGPAHLPGGPAHEASQRPYFSIACLYELEIYLSVNRCSGIQQGIYHYDPLWHTLTLINDDVADLGAMLDLAMVAAGGHRRPSALLTLTARTPRTAWVLGSATYATTLVHVGALQQVLYLNAKAMGLAAHAVPVDAGDRVDRALKLEWPSEVGVGECVLDFPW
ncbi:MAG TPA: SagB/ThcOx family dehydrogenase [Amycolatopsis sp.]|nr:SagB/ThcOx family dehydrogenase [Amycolatopsis sp.]